MADGRGDFTVENTGENLVYKHLGFSRQAYSKFFKSEEEEEGCLCYFQGED